MERTTEQVKGFILERVEQWLSDEGDSVGVSSEYEVLEEIEQYIANDKMLHRHQAKLLETLLDNECRFLAEQTFNSNGLYILQIDTLSIYPDVWAVYCRPGTYQI